MVLRIKYQPLVAVIFSILIVANFSLTSSSAWAWDSAAGNPTHPTHSYLTEWAIDQLKNQYPELQQFRKVIIEGANAELHELPVSGTKYGIDLEAKRRQHQGTNEGCNDIQGWWQDSLTAYRQGQKEQAYFLLGVMLHMIQDMGVPAHANKVYHQGNLTEFDNFEFLALSNWKPKFDDINRQDPGFSEPWKYYAFSQEWTHADAPNYNDRDSFSKFWLTASSSEKRLLSNRQGRTSYLTMWAVNSAIKSFS
ncbi:hypothetical protein [Floridanema aerugineum]|jgi:hypothetical protein|uniref:Zn-dependent PLC domain-containing protein n=1 Tax=Floridaenema aerugineum BLCC-F46 TaxID=3153654 RepID=A0ABV4XH75_9CYAN